MALSTNMASGAEFGYALGWVVLTANLFAMLIQTLSAKLGIATGQSLPEVCRARLPKRFVVALWLQAEAVAPVVYPALENPDRPLNGTSCPVAATWGTLGLSISMMFGMSPACIPISFIAPCCFDVGLK